MQVRWLSLRKLCETCRVDPARGRERAVKAKVTLEKIKHEGRDGRRYSMLCLPEKEKEKAVEAITTLVRGPYKKRRRGYAR